jgi:hypothetical protein
MLNKVNVMVRDEAAAQRIAAAQVKRNPTITATADGYVVSYDLKPLRKVEG